LFFEIRIPINPALGSYPGIKQGNLFDEALERILVVPILWNGTGQTS
jgi:hypothetical protein